MLQMDHFFKVCYIHHFACDVRIIQNRHVDRVIVSEHLPLAQTRNTDAEELKLMGALEDLKKTFKDH